ncbi:beta-secretase 2 [Perognathus longimembris pacificus]|uniref:beta-secretase 2 n=1 Tax=Perognathus longimembris pacificus TaxID=214514 RepID=UPI002018F40D|nr:beta-secretase 2 [Perognathus longimembris pacificus]
MTRVTGTSLKCPTAAKVLHSALVTSVGSDLRGAFPGNSGLEFSRGRGAARGPGADRARGGGGAQNLLNLAARTPGRPRRARPPPARRRRLRLLPPLLLAQWLPLAAPAAPGPAPLALPLRVAAAAPAPGPPALPRADGLALALEPARAAAAANFLAMVDNLRGDSGRGYYLEMLVGTPPQKLQILVDTGSSNFAVAGAPHSYVDSYFDPERSSTYRSKGFDVTVKYTQGSWTGVVGEDLVTIPKGFNSSFLVNIATISESENFFLPGIKWNGILGLAYAALAKPSSSLETFFDSLVAQAKIPDVFSMQMCGVGLPVAASGTNGGSLVLGGIEPSLYKGDIWYTPIKEEWYYQIEILKLEIGGQSLNLDCREYNADKAIVDSGTTLLRLPQKVFDAVVEAVARTSLIPEFSDGFWTGAQLACWMNSETPWSYFPKISIYLREENSSQSFRITILPQLYIQPMMGAGLNYECYRFGISPSTNALVIGATVMEGFYVIFDRARKRLGFATSPCSEMAGVPVSEISGPFSTEDVASSCVPAPALSEPLLWIVSYSLMSVCGLVLLVLILLLLLPCPCRPATRDPEAVSDASSLVRHRWK